MSEDMSERMSGHARKNVRRDVRQNIRRYVSLNEGLLHMSRMSVSAKERTANVWRQCQLCSAVQ